MKNSQTFRNFEVGEPGSNITLLSLNLVQELQLPKRTLLQTDETVEEKKFFFHDFEPACNGCEAHAIVSGGVGFDSRAVQISTVSPTARHRCDVSSELCYPGAKQRKWAPPLVTRYIKE